MPEKPQSAKLHSVLHGYHSREGVKLWETMASQVLLTPILTWCPGDLRKQIAAVTVSLLALSLLFSPQQPTLLPFLMQWIFSYLRCTRHCVSNFPTLACSLGLFSHRYYFLREVAKISSLHLTHCILVALYVHFFLSLDHPMQEALWGPTCYLVRLLPYPLIHKDAAYSVSFQAVSAKSGDKGWLKKAAVITGRFILKV